MKQITQFFLEGESPIYNKALQLFVEKRQFFN